MGTEGATARRPDYDGECVVHWDRPALGCPDCRRDRWGERYPGAPYRRRVVAVARSLVGAPFRHRGRGRSGVDCVGVLAVVAREVGFVVRPFDAYPEDAEGPEVSDRLDERFDRVPPGAEVLPGDFFFLELRRAGRHVGILTDGGTIVHARRFPHEQEGEETGVVEEVPFDARWLRRVLIAYRFPGIDSDDGMGGVSDG